MEPKSKTNIPAEWSEVAVEKVFRFLRTYAISRENLVNGTSNQEGIGNIHYGDIHATYKAASIDLTRTSIPLVKDKMFSPKKEDFLVSGDLIMADVSEDYEGIGATVSVHGLENKQIVGGLHTFALRDAGNKTIERFRQYIFFNPSVRNKLKKIANGVSVYGISKIALSKLHLALPPLSEQKRIVAVLEAWDSYLEKLAKKIGIKKLIKKGLTQQLLTGKKRLKGFTEPWAHVKLSDICKVEMGQSPPSSSYNTTQTGLPLIQGNADLVNRKTIRRIWTSIPTKLAKRSQIIMTVRAPVGLIGVAQEDICIGRGVCAFAAKSADRVYILHHLISLEKRWGAFEQGSTFTAVNGSDIRGLKLTLPKSEEEQTAIAKILTKADDEIEALERKKTVIEAQKKYLLNNLITGTIRTPEDLLERVNGRN